MSTRELARGGNCLLAVNNMLFRAWEKEEIFKSQKT